MCAPPQTHPAAAAHPAQLASCREEGWGKEPEGHTTFAAAAATCMAPTAGTLPFRQTLLEVQPAHPPSHAC